MFNKRDKHKYDVLFLQLDHVGAGVASFKDNEASRTETGDCPCNCSDVESVDPAPGEDPLIKSPAAVVPSVTSTGEFPSMHMPGWDPNGIASWKNDDNSSSCAMQDVLVTGGISAIGQLKKEYRR